jgi:hypothetical protein
VWTQTPATKAVGGGPFRLGSRGGLLTILGNLFSNLLLNIAMENCYLIWMSRAWRQIENKSNSAFSSVHHIQPLSSSPSSYSLAKTRHCVTWNSHNILFLPLDRRPGHFIVKDNILAIGRRSGRLIFLEFKPDLNPLCNV